jgi:hypothetical protein
MKPYSNYSAHWNLLAIWPVYISKLGLWTSLKWQASPEVSLLRVLKAV